MNNWKSKAEGRGQTAGKQLSIVNFFLGLFLLFPFSVFAGSLDSPAASTSSSSAMYTLSDIYNRLNAGTTGSKRTGAFTESSAGPASTGYTLDDIMGKAPAVDDTNGASASEVLSGKTYWGLTSGGWGAQTGALATQTLSAGSTTVSAGYYAATTLDAVDTDLAAANIASGVTIFGVAGSASVCTNPAMVETTGQTTSYSATGGEDGDLQKGVSWPNPRFTDNSDGTVTDNLTGLIWLTNANCYSTQTWEQALADTNALANGTCGLTDSSSAGDWRLPNVKELLSLVDFAYASPALSNVAGTGQWSSGDPFTSVQSTAYWSSTTNSASTTFAWYVTLDGGAAFCVSKTNFVYVWPVRGP